MRCMAHSVNLSLLARLLECLHLQLSFCSGPNDEAREDAQNTAETASKRVIREDENTVLVRRTRYTKLECVGRGGSSKVFKV